MNDLARWRVAGALLLAVTAWFGGAASAADPLGRFPADPQQVSVAGISSGAFMANQLHVAHSSGIMGAGIVAGGPFGCAVDRVTGEGVAALASLAVGPCMSVPSLLKPVAFYAQIATDLAAKGWIDPPGNLARSRVYLFAGKADKVVNPKAVELGASLYRTLGVPTSQITFRDQDLPGTGAGHSWVTKNFGNACDANASPFINDCDYDQAGDVLQSLYGRLEPPAVRPEGRIVAFDQAEFVPRAAAAANGLSATGYLYVPKACEAGATSRAAWPSSCTAACNRRRYWARSSIPGSVSTNGPIPIASSCSIRRPMPPRLPSCRHRTSWRRSTPTRTGAGTGGATAVTTCT